MTGNRVQWTVVRRPRFLPKWMVVDGWVAKHPVLFSNQQHAEEYAAELNRQSWFWDYDVEFAWDNWWQMING